MSDYQRNKDKVLPYSMIVRWDIGSGTFFTTDYACRCFYIASSDSGSLPDISTLALHSFVKGFFCGGKWWYSTEAMAWYTYMLRCSDQSLYTGITNNLEHRLKQHMTGKGSKYVRSRLPVALVHVETYEHKAAASQREFVLKKLTKKEKERLILQTNSLSYEPS